MTAPVHFSAERDGVVMGMNGVDLLWIEGERIAEVWLFSAWPAGRGRVLGQCLRAGLPKPDRASSIHPESRMSRLASNL